MTETTLSAAVRELVVALNARDAEAARKWATDAAWNFGALPLEPICRDEHLMLQVAPMLLETEARAAARVMGFRDDKSRESLWLLFEVQDDWWKCVEATRTRLDAELFLKRQRAAQDPSAGPAPAFPPPDKAATGPEGPDANLERLAKRFAEALEAGDADALRALTEDGHFDGPGDTPERLLRAVRDAQPKVSLVEWRVRGDRAALRIGMILRRGADDIWIVWRQRRGLGWKIVAAPHQWGPAGLFVTGRTDEVPVFGTLPADVGAAKWGEELLATARAGASAPPGMPESEFAALTAPPTAPDHKLVLGKVSSLPTVGRAIVSFDVIDPSATYPVDNRYALLERSTPTSDWTYRGTVGMGSISALIDGLAIEWGDGPGTGPPPSESDEAARQAVLDGIRRVLESNGLDPNAVGVDKMTKEQLEKLVPQVFGGAVSALLGNLVGRLKDNLDEAAARDPEVTVDLGRERARRAGKPVPKLDAAEDAVGREVRSALRDALHAASSDGEVKVDTKFLNEEGPKLLGSLFGAVAKALVPAEATIEVPGGSEDGKDPVKVKLDLGQMFGALFAQAAQQKTPAAKRENEEPDEESDEE